MAAVVSSSGNILGIGYNHLRGWKSTHAEMDAFGNAVRHISTIDGITKSRPSADVVVIRTNGGNSRPCNNCINDMANNQFINIQKVYYSFTDETGISGLAVETMGSLLANSDVHVSRGNLECCAGDDEDEPVKPEKILP